MTKMDHLLEELLRHHHPEPPASLKEVDAFERRMGWKLDPDLRTFYLRCNGARLFKRIDTPYRFLPLSEIVRGRLTIYGLDDDEHGPASWFDICRVHDGNCIVIDVAEPHEGYYPIIDGFHEAYGDPVECRQIADRFSDFLERALTSQGRQFWLYESQGRAGPAGA
jgi:cell wall assembly regulator SMI1